MANTTRLDKRGPKARQKNVETNNSSEVWVSSRPMRDKNDCLLQTQGFRQVVLAPTVHEKH